MLSFWHYFYKLFFLISTGRARFRHPPRPPPPPVPVLLLLFRLLLPSWGSSDLGRGRSSLRGRPEAPAPVLARHADGGREEAAGGRPHEDRAERLRTVNSDHTPTAFWFLFLLDGFKKKFAFSVSLSWETQVRVSADKNDDYLLCTTPDPAPHEEE